MQIKKRNNANNYTFGKIKSFMEKWIFLETEINVDAGLESPCIMRAHGHIAQSH